MGCAVCATEQKHASGTNPLGDSMLRSLRNTSQTHQKQILICLLLQAALLLFVVLLLMWKVENRFRGRCREGFFEEPKIMESYESDEVAICRLAFGLVTVFLDCTWQVA